MKKINFPKIKWTVGTIVKLAMVILIIVFLLISAIYKFAGTKKNGMMGPMGSRGGADTVATITVSAKEITNETIQNTVKVTGNVSSVSEINIYPDTSGKITSIEKKLGDSVKRGDKIAYIDPSKPGSAYIASPVVATISGTIVDLPISLGDTVSSSTTIATVGSLTDLQLKVYVAEKYSDYLKAGMTSYISLTSIPNEKFEAKAVKISPVVNKTTRTIEVDLRFNEYDPRIKPGMFASIELVIQEEKNSFVIPKSCISNFNGKDSVLVIGNGNIAERREITTGIGNDLNIAVLSGLQEGDKVIIAGSATEGSKVRLVGESSENEEREIEDENISDGKMPDLTSGEKPDISFPNGDGKAPKDKAPKDKDQKDKTKDGKK